MFGFKPRQFTDANMLPRLPLIEPLEDRQLLSATVHPATAHTVKPDKAVHAAKTHTKTAKAKKASHKKSKHNTVSSTTSTTTGSTGTTSLPNMPIPFPGQVENTITFSQAPSAVETGLTNLASTDGLAAPTTSQTVYLGNTNGVETYSLHYSSTGESSTITVDQNGNPVTKPTMTTTTYSDLTSTDSAAASEIAAIATALNLTAPTDTTTVNVTTTSSGAVTYSVHLSPSGSTDTSSTVTNSAVGPIVAGSAFDPGGPAIFALDGEISVDAAGNPVGNQRLPFSVLPTSIQSAINANAPAGATTLATDSTQSVSVQTIDGVTLYTTTFNYSGTTTKVTIDEAGTLTSLPSTTTTTFATLSSTVQDELQTLATADGVTTAIGSAQSVTVYTEANGTTIYSVSLSTTTATPVAGSSGETDGYGEFGNTITIAVDSNGNPTVPPRGGIGFGGGEGGWGGGGPIPL